MGGPFSFLGRHLARSAGEQMNLPGRAAQPAPQGFDFGRFSAAPTPDRTPSFASAPEYGQPSPWAQYMHAKNTGSLRTPGRAAPLPPRRPEDNEPMISNMGGVPQQNSNAEFQNPSGQNFTANSTMDNMGRFMQGGSAQPGMETPMDNLKMFLSKIGMFG
jgi:hypothetical protein